MVRHSFEEVTMLHEDMASTLIHALDGGLRLAVNALRRDFAIPLGSWRVAYEKPGLGLVLDRIGAQELAHAELGHHASGQLAGALQVILSPRRGVLQHDLLSCPSTEHHGNTVQEFLAGIEI